MYTLCILKVAFSTLYNYHIRATYLQNTATVTPAGIPIPDVPVFLEPSLGSHFSSPASVHALNVFSGREINL